MTDKFIKGPGEGRSPRAIDRRTVVRGAAWAVPVVALSAAVPMSAASGCNGSYHYRIDWDSWTRASVTASSSMGSIAATPLDGGPPVSLTVSASAFGGATFYHPGSGANSMELDVQTWLHEGLPDGAIPRLYLSQKSPTNGGQNAVFTFSKPIENLKFYIGDIDGANNRADTAPSPANLAWRDRLSLSPETFTTSVIAQDPSFPLPGSGTAADPYSSIQNGSLDTGPYAALAAADFDFGSTSLSSFSIRYTNSSPIGNWGQWISFSPMTFSLPCP